MANLAHLSHRLNLGWVISMLACRLSLPTAREANGHSLAKRSLAGCRIGFFCFSNGSVEDICRTDAPGLASSLWYGARVQLSTHETGQAGLFKKVLKLLGSPHPFEPSELHAHDGRESTFTWRGRPRAIQISFTSNFLISPELPSKQRVAHLSVRAAPENQVK